MTTVYVAVAFDATKTVVLPSVVPPHVSVLVLKLAVAQTISFTVSGVPETSESEDVLVNVTKTPGPAGEVSQNAVKFGRWLTSNGDVFVALVPCVYVEEHRGVPLLPSHIQAYQSFDSAHW
jgi:hypothetical protein